MALKLAVSGVGKDFLIPVIDSVSFTVDTGEFVCLLGPNGCGKTTLLRILGGIEPATRGTVLLDGLPVVAVERHERHVGIVFQEDRLLPWMSLADNVALVLKPLGLDRDARRVRAMHYVRLAGVQGFELYYPGRVSGGLRERAGPARAPARVHERRSADRQARRRAAGRRSGHVQAARFAEDGAAAVRSGSP